MMQEDSVCVRIYFTTYLSMTQLSGDTSVIAAKQ